MAERIDPSRLASLSLHWLADGCNETTCPRHGEYVAELRRRSTTTHLTDEENDHA